MKKKFHLPLAAHIFFWVTTAAWAALSELNLIPTDYAALSPSTAYTLDILSIVTAIGGGWMAMRLLSLDIIRRKIADTDLTAAATAYCRWAGVRTIAIGLSLWYNVVIYYACTSRTTAVYCLLIAAIASLFCLPSERDFTALRTANGKKS